MLERTAYELQKKNIESDKDSNINSIILEQDLEELRKQIEKRPKAMEEDSKVKAARSAVITCLRTNEKRPLNCYKEVEHFKESVKTLQRSFIQKYQ